MQQDDVRDVIMLAMSLGIGFVSLRWKKATVMGGSSVLGAFSVTNGIDHWGNTGFSTILTNVLDYQTSSIIKYSALFTSSTVGKQKLYLYQPLHLPVMKRF